MIPRVKNKKFKHLTKFHFEVTNKDPCIVFRFHVLDMFNVGFTEIWPNFEMSLKIKKN